MTLPGLVPHTTVIEVFPVFKQNSCSEMDLRLFSILFPFCHCKCMYSPCRQSACFSPLRPQCTQDRAEADCLDSGDSVEKNPLCRVRPKGWTRAMGRDPECACVSVHVCVIMSVSTSSNLFIQDFCLFNYYCIRGTEDALLTHECDNAT